MVLGFLPTVNHKSLRSSQARSVKDPSHPDGMGEQSPKLKNPILRGLMFIYLSMKKKRRSRSLETHYITHQKRKVKAHLNRFFQSLNRLILFFPLDGSMGLRECPSPLLLVRRLVGNRLTSGRVWTKEWRSNSTVPPFTRRVVEKSAQP